jgi:integrase
MYEKLLPEEPNYFKVLKAHLPRSRSVRPTQAIEHAKVLAGINETEDLQDRTMFSLLLYTGIRRSELVALNIDSVRPTHLILPHTKAGEPQIQVLPQAVKKTLAAWCKHRAKMINENKHVHSDKKALFVLKQGANLQVRMTVDAVYRRFKKTFGVPPHAARATAITLLKAKGASDSDVAKFVRHASPTMVQIYDKRTNIEQTMADLMEY